MSTAIMHDKKQLRDDKPWFKQFWPWYLIALPASAVVAGVITLFIAITHQDALVVSNYYKQGLAINLVLSKQQAAADLGVHSTLFYNDRLEQLSVQLPKKFREQYAQLSLQLVHPTLAAQDKNLLLSKNKRGEFTTRLVALQSGRWKMILEPLDQSWQLEHEGVFPLAEPLHISPNKSSVAN